MDKYSLGRALAAERDARLDNYDDTGSWDTDRVDAIDRDIEAAGGWDAETQRGYDDAKREYARER